ncbi:MAG: cytochrome P450, partial [Kutzneria sp.]|nr:cytochrome P450 [Kutzneria sp.]
MTPTPAVPVHMRRNLFDPVEELMKLQDDAPVSLVELPFNAWSVPAWLVTGYHDIREVLGNAARFSSSSERMRDFLVANVGEAMEPQRPSATAGSFIEADPPEHTRLRRLLIPEFTVRRMRRLRPRIEAIVSEHLDAMQSHGGPVDLVQALALPVPSLVICELLGVPYADRLDFQRHTSVMLDAESSPDEQEAANDSARAYMTELVRSQRADPGEDLLGMLIREHGSDLSEEELVGIGVLLLIAGHETTANMLGLGTLALLSHPDQWALLRSDTERVDRAVEELMRYLTVV